MNDRTDPGRHATWNSVARRNCPDPRGLPTRDLDRVSVIDGPGHMVVVDPPPLAGVLDDSSQPAGQLQNSSEANRS